MSQLISCRQEDVKSFGSSQRHSYMFFFSLILGLTFLFGFSINAFAQRNPDMIFDVSLANGLIRPVDGKEVLILKFTTNECDYETYQSDSRTCNYISVRPDQGEGTLPDGSKFFERMVISGRISPAIDTVDGTSDVIPLGCYKASISGNEETYCTDARNILLNLGTRENPEIISYFEAREKSENANYRIEVDGQSRSVGAYTYMLNKDIAEKGDLNLSFLEHERSLYNRELSNLPGTNSTAESGETEASSAGTDTADSSDSDESSNSVASSNSTAASGTDSGNEVASSEDSDEDSEENNGSESTTRPDPSQESESGLPADLLSFKAKEEIREVYKITTDSNGKKSYQQPDSIKLPEGAEFKVLPEQRKEFGGRFYREIEYKDPDTGELSSLLIPEKMIVDSDGNVMNENTALSQAEKTAQEEELAQEEADTVQEQTEQEEDEPSRSSSTLNTCSNPDYINSLTSSNPNCRLVPANSLVYSSLEKGQALIAQSKDSKACFKLEVDKELQTNNSALNKAINDYIGRRRDRYDEIAHLIQRGNDGGFVSSGEPKANKLTSSCVVRLNSCTLSVGLREPMNMDLSEEIEIPKTGLVSSVRQKLQIYGPSREGYYLIKHIEGVLEKRTFVTTDRAVVAEAVSLMQEYQDEFPIKNSMDDYDDVFDQEALKIERPVLRLQRTDSEGELEESKTISMDPDAPFRRIFETNTNYNYYDIQCTETFNPLEEPDRGVSQQEESRPGFMDRVRGIF